MYVYFIYMYYFNIYIIVVIINIKLNKLLSISNLINIVNIVFEIIVGSLLYIYICIISPFTYYIIYKLDTKLSMFNINNDYSLSSLNRPSF